ncbi:MAG: MFS transporter [Flavobacteriaceae bacterium]|nr:MFS transporter [Flavobacteriaceae bacterium]
MSLFAVYKKSFANLPGNVWLLASVQFINRSGSMVLLFASLYFTKELQYSMAQAGLVMSFYGIGSILGSYAGGWLTDRKNYFDIMFWSLISSGLILLLLLVTTSPFFVASVVFLYAFAADSFRPANSASLAVYSTPENRTRSVSLLRMAINLGFSVGPAIGGIIALHFGYKFLFIIDSLTSFGAAALLYFYLPRKNIRKRTKTQQAVLDDRSTSAYRDIPYLFFILLVALYATCFFQLFASVPQYFSEVCHYNEGTIGFMLGLNGLLVVLIEMPLIAYFEHKASIFRFIIIAVLAIPIAFLILLFSSGTIGMAILYTLFITFAEIFAMPFMMNFALSRPPKERQGQYSALYSIAYGLALIAAPSIGLGIAATYGFNSMFFLIIATSCLVAMGFAVLKKYALK